MPWMQEILLPSAVHLEERLTVSQSVPEPASRQSDRYTQFGFFVSGRRGTKLQRGSEATCHNPNSGRVVTQPAGIRVVVGSNPSSAHFGAAASGGAKSQQIRIRTDACTSGIGCAAIGPLAMLPAPCVPTACSLLSKNF